MCPKSQLLRTGRLSNSKKHMNTDDSPLYDRIVSRPIAIWINIIDTKGSSPPSRVSARDVAVMPDAFLALTTPTTQHIMMIGNESANSCMESMDDQQVHKQKLDLMHENDHSTIQLVRVREGNSMCKPLLNGESFTKVFLLVVEPSPY